MRSDAPTAELKRLPEEELVRRGRVAVRRECHIGQIVLLAKHRAGHRWQTLSIPRGKSEDFNRQRIGGSTSRGSRE